MARKISSDDMNSLCFQVSETEKLDPFPVKTHDVDSTPATGESQPHIAAGISSGLDLAVVYSGTSTVRSEIRVYRFQSANLNSLGLNYYFDSAGDPLEDGMAIRAFEGTYIDGYLTIIYGNRQTTAGGWNYFVRNLEWGTSLSWGYHSEWNIGGDYFDDGKVCLTAYGQLVAYHDSNQTVRRYSRSGTTQQTFLTVGNASPDPADSGATISSVRAVGSMGEYGSISGNTYRPIVISVVLSSGHSRNLVYEWDGNTAQYAFSYQCAIGGTGADTLYCKRIRPFFTYTGGTQDKPYGVVATVSNNSKNVHYRYGTFIGLTFANEIGLYGDPDLNYLPMYSNSASGQRCMMVLIGTKIERWAMRGSGDAGVPDWRYFTPIDLHLDHINDQVTEISYWPEEGYFVPVSNAWRGYRVSARDFSQMMDTLEDICTYYGNSAGTAFTVQTFLQAVFGQTTWPYEPVEDEMWQEHTSEATKLDVWKMLYDAAVYLNNNARYEVP